MIGTNEVTVIVPCVDCGTDRHVAREALLWTRGICGVCYIGRAIRDYEEWCGYMEVTLDPESADEYLAVTDYGSNLPEWIQVRVREHATKAASCAN